MYCMYMYIQTVTQAGIIRRNGQLLPESKCGKSHVAKNESMGVKNMLFRLTDNCLFCD
jgi:hypothetical protein